MPLSRAGCAPGCQCCPPEWAPHSMAQPGTLDPQSAHGGTSTPVAAIVDPPPSLPGQGGLESQLRSAQGAEEGAARQQQHMPGCRDSPHGLSAPGDSRSHGSHPGADPSGARPARRDRERAPHFPPQKGLLQTGNDPSCDTRPVPVPPAGRRDRWGRAPKGAGAGSPRAAPGRQRGHTGAEAADPPPSGRRRSSRPRLGAAWPSLRAAFSGGRSLPCREQRGAGPHRSASAAPSRAGAWGGGVGRAGPAGGAGLYPGGCHRLRPREGNERPHWLPCPGGGRDTRADTNYWAAAVVRGSHFVCGRSRHRC